MDNYYKLYEDEIKEYNEELKQALKDLKASNESILNLINAYDCKEQLKDNYDEILSNILEAKTSIESYEKQINDYLNDEVIMEAIDYFKEDMGDIKQNMLNCLEYIKEFYELTDKIVKNIDEINKPQNMKDVDYKMNNSRVLDL